MTVSNQPAPEIVVIVWFSVQAVVAVPVINQQRVVQLS